MDDYLEIMQAIISGDIERLEEYSQIVDAFPTGKDHFVARHWITNAIECGNAEVVAWMLNKKAPVIFCDDEGMTVLHSAIERQEKTDKYRILKLLIQAGADLNAHGSNDWTPAHLAAVMDDVKALKILRQAGADFAIRTRIDDGATPYQEAVLVGRSPRAVAYLKQRGRD